MDETTMDVASAGKGEQIAPQSEPSQTEPVQDSPGGESQIEALSQQVKSLAGIVSALQSDKDRRIPAIEKQLKAQAEQLEAYHQRREAGQSHEEAMKAQILDEIVAERLGDTKVPPTLAEAQPAPVAIADYLSPLLLATGLDANDAGVIDIVRNERDAAKQMTAIAALAASKKQITPPNPAAVMPTGSGKAVEGDTLESITAELQAELQKPATPQTREKIRELGKRQKELLPKR